SSPSSIFDLAEQIAGSELHSRRRCTRVPDDNHPVQLRPETDVLTRGFDPSLSVGSARPAVFRSSTYVFSSPETAERAFDLMAGRGQRTPGENVDLVYSRFNHPNAQILE